MDGFRYNFKGTICILGKTICNIRQKGGSPLLLPASVLQLPRCLVRICNLFHKDNQAANWKVSKSAIAAGKTSCKFYLLRKRGLLAHTSPAFLKNCWIKKLLFACGSQLKAVQLDLLRKCGLLVHTSAAFLKNCCIEKLFRMIQCFL